MQTLYSYFKKLFLETTNNTGLQLFRYTFVGGTAFVVDLTALFILTDFFHLHYLVSAIFAFLFGFATNFLLANQFVFKNQRPDNIHKELVAVMTISLLGLGLNELLLWVFTTFLGVCYLGSKAISAIIIYGFNFFARKLFVYKK
jgi:putative flippase GtrA